MIRKNISKNIRLNDSKVLKKMRKYADEEDAYTTKLLNDAEIQGLDPSTSMCVSINANKPW